jgi:gamma-glutamylcyclotransferase (GGCT)/AIG2-like uncharacterized protein YtfP
MKKGDLVAVYGTLKHGHSNHEILSLCALHSVEWLPGYKMWDLGSFPAITETDENCSVKVEVYKIDHNYTAEDLDALEGYPILYQRKQTGLKNGFCAWIYYMENKPNNNQIKNGEW